MIGLCLALAAGITLLVNLLLVLCWLRHYQPFSNRQKGSTSNEPYGHHPELRALPLPHLEAFPAVAILLAVRNEAHNLGVCLDHLLAQDYPAAQYAIWIGNDGSTDHTLAIALDYAARYGHIHVVDVQENLGEARAKANVVAHLVHASQQQQPTADCLLVTDADTRPPRHWMRGMIHAWQVPSGQSTGIVTGTTLVLGNSAWAQLQRTDWLFSLGMVKVASDLGFPTATLGNNNLMSRQAYEATGGYETMPFSITEDFQVLHAIAQKGYGFKNVINPYVINFTLPMPTVFSLVAQRRRWMHGALQLPWHMVGILLLQACFYPIIFGLALHAPALAAALFAGKLLTQSAFIIVVAKKLALQHIAYRRLSLLLLPYDVYIACINFLTLMYYLLPAKIRWKDRTF